MSQLDLIHKLAGDYTGDPAVREFIRSFHVELDEPVMTTCPIACLGLSGLAYHRLTRGRALDRPLITIAEVIELAQESALTTIEGVGRRCAGEIYTRLIFSGFILETAQGQRRRRATRRERTPD